MMGVRHGSSQRRRYVIRSQSFVRVNHKIRVPRVRCVDADGTMVGVVPTKEAFLMAQKRGLDLVEISPNADPPVCRIMDFGKYRYDESVKKKKARKTQQSRAVKEIKFHSNVAEHDYKTKVHHICEFLEKGHKVKITLTFRGRENAHRELGFEVMKRVIGDCEAVGAVDMSPKLMGRSLGMMLRPQAQKSRSKKLDE